MPSNIKNNSVRSLKLRCRNDEYYDFMLYRGECSGDFVPDGCMVANINANNVDVEPGKPITRNDLNGKPSIYGGEVYSTVSWGEAVTSDEEMKDIGFTGIDNGFIAYRRDRITNREFVDMFTGTTYPISDDRFFMSPVSGNTTMFKYPMYMEEDEGGKYFAMKGGFYQGYFKLYGLDYQTLPNYIDDNWNLEFVIRRRDDYDVVPGTINNLHPENKGIFFYMGTRAENKFWHYYNKPEDKTEFLIPSVFNDGYFDDCDYMVNYITVPEYTDYVEACGCNEYFSDEYMTVCDEENEGHVWCEEYVEKDLDLNGLEVHTSDGNDLYGGGAGYFEIETDNKFIFFNRTCTGFTVDDWGYDENDYKYDECGDHIVPDVKEKPTIILTGKTSSCKENKFITYNRTCTGKTVNNHNLYLDENYEAYDVYKDIKNNVFALKIDDNGRIGYRFGIADCDEDSGYGIKEEYSKPNIIPEGEWVKIDVRFKILNNTYNQCFVNGGQEINMVPGNLGKRKMKIYIYVNGYLVFISQELPEFNFRELNDIYQKQEGVPFSISLGGGSLGLLEEIGLNYYMTPEYCLPIERDFAGTFMGDIRSFRFFNCWIDAQTIRNNAL